MAPAVMLVGCFRLAHESRQRARNGTSFGAQIFEASEPPNAKRSYAECFEQRAYQAGRHCSSMSVRSSTKTAPERA